MERVTGIEYKGIFKKVNGSFNSNSVSIKVVPMLGTSGNAGIQSEVFVRICIYTLAVGRGSTGMFTGTHTGVVGLNGAMADPFKSQ